MFLFCRSTHCAHSLAIGDSFPVRWESTLTPFWTDWSCDPMKMGLNNYAEKVKIICIFLVYMRKCMYICIEIAVCAFAGYQGRD